MSGHILAKKKFLLLSSTAITATLYLDAFFNTKYRSK